VSCKNQTNRQTKEQTNETRNVAYRKAAYVHCCSQVHTIFMIRDKAKVTNKIS